MFIFMKHNHLWFLILFFSLWISSGILSTSAQLHADEVQALKEIGEQMGKNDWDFSVDPCMNDRTWREPESQERPLYNSSVECSCIQGLCRVVRIYLKGQDLSGVLPPSLAKLPNLTTIDFARNCLRGNIPREWTSMNQLSHVAISANNLSGPIPGYLGNITSLVHLNLESNMLSENIPPEIGNLLNLDGLILRANNLTGALPETLSRLTKLTRLRLSGNNFVGKIPDFLSNLTNLTILEIQAGGFEGPIPSGISKLTKLEELRISDLNGDQGSEFPPLRNMKNMLRLMLRSCNLFGKIPTDISELKELRKLDFSFNRLEGDIKILGDLPKLEIMYLTNNLFNGPIPDSSKKKDFQHQIDLSYNNFSESSVPTSCRETQNLYRSFSSKHNSSLAKCQNMNPCSQNYYSLHINCGGKTTIIGNNTYEEDQDPGGAARFVPRDYRWGVSTSGEFWDIRDGASNIYIANNVSVLESNDSKLYINARRSALSTTYYARCLGNGNYTVRLHFMEIIFRDDSSFSSLGTRIFDVYIQEKLVLKDFNIEKEAGGVDKVTMQTFNQTRVENNVLEIRFHWAGKGTTIVPDRGSYGPLISAISVDPEFKPPQVIEKREGLTGQEKILIAVGVVLLVLFLVLTILRILCLKGFLGGRSRREKELQGLDLQTGFFTYKQIKAATNNFDPANKIGEGGFGAVYKGTLSDGNVIAVKQLSSKSKQGTREFVNEIGMITALQHPNLVRLYGCCVEKHQLFLVYEFMENNSLASALLGPEETRLKLDWPTRQKICIGIAKGLAFIHEESALRVVHRDIKCTNILLDKDLNPKISDFGLAKLDEDEKTHISTRVAGTAGYMAPEYVMWGYLTYKADVYSFGVVLELVSGQSTMNYRPTEDNVSLVDSALVLGQRGDLKEFVDPSLGSEFNEEEAVRMIKVAILCTNSSPTLRPVMSAVLSMLECRTTVHELLMDPTIYNNRQKLAALRDQFNQYVQQQQQPYSSESPSLIHSTRATISSSSIPTMPITSP